MWLVILCMTTKYIHANKRKRFWNLAADSNCHRNRPLIGHLGDRIIFSICFSSLDHTFQDAFYLLWVCWRDCRHWYQTLFYFSTEKDTSDNTVYALVSIWYVPALADSIILGTNITWICYRKVESRGRQLQSWIFCSRFYMCSDLRALGTGQGVHWLCVLSKGMVGTKTWIASAGHVQNMLSM